MNQGLIIKETMLLPFIQKVQLCDIKTKTEFIEEKEIHCIKQGNNLLVSKTLHNQIKEKFK
jgi:hypothetical protein